MLLQGVGGGWRCAMPCISEIPRVKEVSEWVSE